MSISYQAVGWNRQKLIYDGALVLVLLLGLAGYSAVLAGFNPNTTFETLVIRYSALCALVLLHLILLIGPLARLSPLFLPLLYNRRHLGVTMFLLALLHGVFSIVQFNAAGDANPVVSAFTAYSEDYVSFSNHLANLAEFPFEIFGLGALVIFFLMAATSHDFWLKNLGPARWKALHLMVYVAYALVLLHVLLGAIQFEKNPVFVVLLGFGFALVVSLHLIVARREHKRDVARREAEADGYVAVADLAKLREAHGHVVVIDGERIALFVHKGKLYGLSNVCRHQGGPLGEGRILYDCVTCPWHGYQYRPEDGCSPPPFTEIVSTYPVRVVGNQVYVQPKPLPLQTRSEGVACALPFPTEPSTAPFYIGWKAQAEAPVARHLLRTVAVIGLILPALLGLSAWLENPIDSGGYEFGVDRLFSGEVVAEPVPYLHVEAQNSHPGGGLNYLLIGEGKRAVPREFLNVSAGNRVRFTGRFLYWHDLVMVEVAHGTRTEILGAAATGAGADSGCVKLGRVTLTGELVDTKCFFGAMRPATGKIHRACAVRCLSGGVPPGLLVHDPPGEQFVFLLAGQPQHPLSYDFQWAARTIEVVGDLELDRQVPVLRADSMRLVPIGE